MYVSGWCALVKVPMTMQSAIKSTYTECECLQYHAWTLTVSLYLSCWCICQLVCTMTMCSFHWKTKYEPSKAALSHLKTKTENPYRKYTANNKETREISWFRFFKLYFAGVSYHILLFSPFFFCCCFVLWEIAMWICCTIIAPLFSFSLSYL